MPKKLASDPFLVSKVTEKLNQWGKAIHTTRVTAHVTARSLCERIDISESTLRRMEGGDSTVSVGSYLNAMFALGILDLAVPPPDGQFVEIMKTIDPHRRAIDPHRRGSGMGGAMGGSSRHHPIPGESDDDDYF